MGGINAIVQLQHPEMGRPLHGGCVPLPF